MKAIRIHAFGEADVLKLETIADPTPAAGQVLIDVRAIGVNPVDTYIRAGKYGPREFPFTPGSDASGLVISVGDGVKSFKAGDRVYTGRTVSGAYAEKTVADQFNVYPLPESATFQRRGPGRSLCDGICALFFRGHAMPGETVLIHGASGSVGTAATQMAHQPRLHNHRHRR